MAFYSTSIYTDQKKKHSFEIKFKFQEIFPNNYQNFISTKTLEVSTKISL